MINCTRVGAVGVDGSPKVGCLVGGGAGSDRVRVFQPITLLGSSLERRSD